MRHATLPVWLHHQLVGRADLLRSLDGLMRSQWWTPEEWEKYQRDQLRRTIAVASTLPYYREIFARAGLSDPRDLQRVDDLRVIPPLSKETVRNHLCDISTADAGAVENHTGGSTGVPLRFFADAEWSVREKPAANTRPYCAYGYRIGDPMAVLWGMDRDLGRGKRREQMIRRYVYHQDECNAFALTRDRFDRLIQTIRRGKTRCLKGYAGAIEELARHIHTTGVTFSTPLKAVFSEAESLTADRRRTIELALGVHVTDIYGCREFGTIAWECGSLQGLHVNAEQLFVELEGNDLLITSFMPRGTIFLRYAIGDMAGGLEMSTCSCGRSSPRIVDLLGRRSDNFVTKDGRMIHGEFVTHLLYGTQSIEQFQVVQKTLDHLVVRYISGNPSVAKEDLRKIHHALDEQFGYPLRIDLEQVCELPKSANGKYRFTISEVPRAKA